MAIIGGCSAWRYSGDHCQMAVARQIQVPENPSHKLAGDFRESGMKLTYDEWRKGRSHQWLTSSISRTCEVDGCDKPTVAAYPAMSGGWIALCANHNRKHKAFPTDELIAKGERWK